jgi:hypothetical protein
MTMQVGPRQKAHQEDTTLRRTWPDAVACADAGLLLQT